jgi:hypothetical protein
MSRSMVPVLFVVVLASLICCVSCAKKEPGETGTPAAEGSQQAAKSEDSGTAYASYLTTADVERVTGRAGITSVPKNSTTGAGGDLNFATSDGKLALMVQILEKKYFAQFKAYFKSSVAGVGDEAFQGETLRGYPTNLFMFTKGETCVALTSFPEPSSGERRLFVTADQEIELAKIIASRM